MGRGGLRNRLGRVGIIGCGLIASKHIFKQAAEAWV